MGRNRTTPDLELPAAGICPGPPPPSGLRQHLHYQNGLIAAVFDAVHYGCRCRGDPRWAYRRGFERTPGLAPSGAAFRTGRRPRNRSQGPSCCCRFVGSSSIRERSRGDFRIAPGRTDPTPGGIHDCRQPTPLTVQLACVQPKITSDGFGRRADRRRRVSRETSPMDCHLCTASSTGCVGVLRRVSRETGPPVDNFCG